MKNANPKQTTKWLNIMFLVINISAFITLLVFSKPGNEPGAAQKVSSLEFLKEELDLTDDQFEEIGKLDDKVFRSYHILVDLLCEAHFGLMDELGAEYPSDQKLDSLANKIGNLNAALKKQTIKHFMNIKLVCSEEQDVQLSNLFREMMNLDENCEICNKKECPRKERLEQMQKKR
jgi:hypothetical protein